MYSLLVLLKLTTTGTALPNIIANILPVFPTDQCHVASTAYQQDVLYRPSCKNVGRYHSFHPQLG